MLDKMWEKKSEIRFSVALTVAVYLSMTGGTMGYPIFEKMPPHFPVYCIASNPIFSDWLISAFQIKYVYVYLKILNYS